MSKNPLPFEPRQRPTRKAVGRWFLGMFIFLVVYLAIKMLIRSSY